MSDHQLTILSWNIRQGGGTRVAKITKFIRESGAQIVQLSEYRNNQSGIQLRNFLLRAGYRFQFVTSASPHENSVLIASKIAASCDIPMGNYPHKNKCLDVGFGVFRLLGLYMPHKKPHKLFELVSECISLSVKPYIIAGDLNTGKNYIDQKGDSFWYTHEFDALLNRGFTDAFRHIYADKSEYSWYSSQGNGFRYDHVLVDSTLLPIVEDCIYAHEVRHLKLSDHSAMLLKLKA